MEREVGGGGGGFQARGVRGDGERTADFTLLFHFAAYYVLAI